MKADPSAKQSLYRQFEFRRGIHSDLAGKFNDRFMPAECNQMENHGTWAGISKKGFTQLH
jgi:hypothetical protein